MMRELILALVGGIGVGVLFGAIKVPIPGPASLSGVLGAIGLYTELASNTSALGSSNVLT